MVDKQCNQIKVMNGDYTGELIEGKAHGYGVCSWQDGAKYEGHWKDNKMHGYGKFTWPDKTVYEGEWILNKINGVGQHTWPNGSKYDGEWLNNKMHGWGTYTWSCGTLYEGPFQNNLKHGQGSLFKRDGSYFLGLWDNNILIREIMANDVVGEIGRFVRFTRRNKEIIYKAMQHRNIKHLVHFTRVDNLKSILEHGLVPVSEHTEHSIKSMINDDDRLDSYLSATSCSIEFPNYRLFYYYRENKHCNSDWLVIRINASVLLFDAVKVYFCQTNAANLSHRMLGTEVESFENMFAEKLTTKSGKIIDRSNLKIPKKFTTDPQAEVLIEGVISPEYFHSLTFNNKNVIDVHGIDLKKVTKKMAINISPDLFMPRSDYEHWR